MLQRRKCKEQLIRSQIVRLVFVISANPLVEANSGLGDVECVICKCTSLVLDPFIGIIALTYHYNG